MNKVYTRKQDNAKLFVGVVAGEPERFSRDGKDSVTLTLQDYAGEAIQVFFHNDEGNAPREKMLADRIEKAKIANGSFMSILAYADADEYTATAIDFKCRGIWTFNDERQTTVIMGTACKPRTPKQGMFCISIPIDSFANGQRSTTWYGVTFFDGEKDGKSWHNATRASRALYGEDKPPVCVVGGPVTEKVQDGKTYRSVIGYHITRKPECMPQ